MGQITSAEAIDDADTLALVDSRSIAKLPTLGPATVHMFSRLTTIMTVYKLIDILHVVEGARPQGRQPRYARMSTIGISKEDSVCGASCQVFHVISFIRVGRWGIGLRLLVKDMIY